MTWLSTGDRVCVRHGFNLTSDLAPTNVGKLLDKKKLFRFQNGERPENVSYGAPMMYYPVGSYPAPSVTWWVITEPDSTRDKKNDLDCFRKRIEDEGIARQHGDTLEKRGISVDGFLNPSSVKDLKNIQYYRRVSLCAGCPRR